MCVSQGLAVAGEGGRGSKGLAGVHVIEGSREVSSSVTRGRRGCGGGGGVGEDWGGSGSGGEDEERLLGRWGLGTGEWR